MTFLKKLESAIKNNNSLLCIGLDPNIERIPKLNDYDLIFTFNKQIIDSTHNLVCAYKPNIAYYEAYGIEGLKSLKKTIDYLKSNFKDIPIILDAKRGDINNTASMYAKSAFEYWQADAVTINPYLGFDSIEPFLEYKDKGVFILCKTTNPGAKDFQDLSLYSSSDPAQLGSREVPLYHYIAQKLVAWSKEYPNCFMVVGATYPKELKQIRTIAQSMFFLVPGIGTQGGDLEKTLKNGLRYDKSGLILNVSRAIMYRDNPKEKAKEYRDLINKYRQQ